jgi:hypothetical protein
MPDRIVSFFLAGASVGTVCGAVSLMFNVSSEWAGIYPCPLYKATKNAPGPRFLRREITETKTVFGWLSRRPAVGL